MQGMVFSTLMRRVFKRLKEVLKEGFRVNQNPLNKNGQDHGTVIGQVLLNAFCRGLIYRYTSWFNSFFVFACFKSFFKWAILASSGVCLGLFILDGEISCALL